MTRRLNDARLADIERRYAWHARWPAPVSVAWVKQATADIQDLAAEVKSLRGELSQERQRAGHAEKAHDNLLNASDDTHARWVQAEGDLRDLLKGGSS